MKSSESQSDLTTFRDSPWISLGLFGLTYAAFGALAAGQFPEWQQWILTYGDRLPGEVLINQAIAANVSWLFGATLVVLLMVVLTAPLRIVRLLFGSWLRSDTRAFLSVLGWALAAVLIVCWMHHFATVFVLISAGVLCHLDLQLCGYRAWHVFWILTALSLGSYTLGTYLFAMWRSFPF